MTTNTPKAAILAVVLVICSELAFHAITDPLIGAPVFEPTADDAVVSAKQRMLASNRRAKIVFVGDSSCLMGVVPHLVTHETGIQAVNLGTLSSMTVAGFSAMGQVAMKHHPKPSAIVLVVLPRAFEVTAARAREFGQVSRYSIAYRQKLHDYKLRSAEVRSWFARKHRMNRFPSEFGGSFAAFEHQLIDQKGFWAEAGVYHGNSTPRTNFNSSPWAINQLRHLADIARSQNIQVYLWLSPRPTDHCTRDYLLQAYDSLALIANESENLTMLQMEIPHLSPSSFGTESHLKEKDAILNSEELGIALRIHIQSAVATDLQQTSPRSQHN